MWNNLQQSQQPQQPKLNEYTNAMTPGQTTRLGAHEVIHNYNVYLGRNPTDAEVNIYQNHPDDKVLIKNLKMLKDQQQPPEIQQAPEQQPPNQGQGGPGDEFAQNLAQGAGQVGQKVNTILSQFGNVARTVSNSTTASSKPGGFRTDNHNNPTAFTTDVAKSAGLIPGVDYTQGNPFVGGDNRTYYTARLVGDPVATTMKVIDRIGLYTSSGKPRWSYIASIPGSKNWSSLTPDQKKQVIGQMYHFEGGSGKLMGQGGPLDGQGGPTNLGNVTTNFGDQTRNSSFHTGVDIANREGTPIPEFTGGQVTGVGSAPDYGNYVTVKTPSGYTERYSHLKQSMVQTGQQLSPGQQVGAMGRTGNVYSSNGGDPSHLHFEVTDAFNKFVNPSRFINT